MRISRPLPRRIHRNPGIENSLAASLERALKRAAALLLRAMAPRGRAFDPASPDAPKIRSILVIRQHNQLGDMLCVVPLLRALRAAYSGARLTLMSSPVNFEVMRGNRYLDETLNYDKRAFLGRAWIRIAPLMRFMRMLRKRSFDMVLVPATVSSSFTSDLLAVVTGAPVRIGTKSLDGVQNPTGFVYTHPVVLDWRNEPSRHQTLRNLDIAAGLNLPPQELSLDITLTEEEKSHGRSVVAGLRKEGGPVVAIHPGAGKLPNRWPPTCFAQLCKALSDSAGAGIIVTAGPMDDETIMSLCKVLEIKPYLLQDQPIRLVASILSEVDLLVSNDTGIMHVGAAVGTPVLSLFGPTDPGQWAPPGLQHRFFRGKGGNIEAIPLDEVVGAALAMLGTNAGTIAHQQRYEK
jgi:ADP-heptose:LPS heptosyltransferase